MSEVVWKAIPGYEGIYEASSKGTIRNLVSGIYYPLPPRYPNILCMIDKNGIKKTRTIYRLVAMTFLGEPKPGKDVVNHKNGDTGDNRIENLEWCDQLHNVRHGLARRMLSKLGITSFSAYDDFASIYEKAVKEAMK